jgi:hypothetical protein
MAKKKSKKAVAEWAAHIREVCKPFSSEEAKQEAAWIQHKITVHGIDAFDNPQFQDAIRWAMTAGFTFEFPSDEKFYEIQKIGIGRGF